MEEKCFAFLEKCKLDFLVDFIQPQQCLAPQMYLSYLTVCTEFLGVICVRSIFETKHADPVVRLLKCCVLLTPVEGRSCLHLQIL